MDVFLRLVRQQDDAAMDYKSLYSGGLNFDGIGWNQDGDNISIGYTYLDGGNQGIKHTQAAEAYYRAVLNNHVAITADVQYMKDEITRENQRQENPQG